LTLGTVKTQDARQAALLYRYFYDLGLVRSEFFAPPTLKYTLPQLNFWLPKWTETLSTEEKREAESLISTVLKTVLSRGALIGGEPAFDPHFQCLDFLTIIDREKSFFLSESQGWMQGAG